MAREQLYEEKLVPVAVMVPKIYKEQLRKLAKERDIPYISILLRPAIRKFLQKELGDKFVDELN